VPRLPRATFAQIANRSLSEVLTRSLITGLSTVFLIGVILIFGGETLRDFAFAMMVGVLSGTYSSIFIATPVLIHWKEREPAYRARAAQIRETMGYVPAFPEENEVARVDRDEEETGDGDGVAPARAPESEPAPEPEPVTAGRAAPEPPEGGDGGAPASAEEPMPAELSERERRLEARRRRQAAKRKHGRPR
jgi:SecD/SecF fusion protein